MSDERYEYVKAIVEDGELRWEWRLVGSSVRGRLAHDENVTGWSDRDIMTVTCLMLDVSDDEREVVTIEYR